MRFNGSRAAGEPDIIHWNNGIWDMYAHLQDGKSFITPEEYGGNIIRILRELRALCPGSRVLFATTTPVSDQNALITNESIDRINEIARRVMQAEGVEIDDLNRALRGRPELICEDLLHLTPQGLSDSRTGCCTGAVTLPFIKAYNKEVFKMEKRSIAVITSGNSDLLTLLQAMDLSMTIIQPDDLLLYDLDAYESILLLGGNSGRAAGAGFAGD